MKTEYEIEFEDVPKRPYSYGYEDRNRLIAKYSWAIPNSEAISKLVDMGPLVEGGAGSGYWAHLIQRAGGDIVAYDAEPPDTTWTQVRRGSDTEVSAHKDRTLFLCWPPYNTSMGYYHILSHGGEHVVYVGESRGGCTGDEQMHWLLDTEYRMVDRVLIPTWPSVSDWLMVFRKI